MIYSGPILSGNMYFRIAHRESNGRDYDYLQLVEAYREEGKNRQRVLLSLGNVDDLRNDGQLGRLVDSLQRATGCRLPAPEEALVAGRVLEYGGVRLAQQLWEQLGLGELLEKLLADRRYGFDVPAAIATLVFNRLLAPKSELAIFAWRDRLWWPPFAQAPLELPDLYKTLDALIQVKEPLEEALFQRLRDLFNLEVDVVFYDLTSTYFEGEGPPMAAYGYSRDKRFDCPQVLLALACDRHGFPVAHEVLPGNRADVSTVKQIVDALGKRFKLNRIIFVSDSGMVSDENLTALDEANYEYLVAVRRRHVPDVERRGPQDLSTYQAASHGVRVYVTDGERPRTRYVCCYSEPRAEEERQIRQARIDRGKQALAKLSEQVVAGRLKAADKIAARAATKLQTATARKYFSYDVADGQFDFQLREEVVAAEERIEGRYYLLTNASQFTATDAVDAFFTLQEVERAFREMKDFLRLRPIFHHLDRRVKAHILVCVLAYLLERCFSYQLRQAGLDMSPRKGLDWVTRIHTTELTVADKTVWAVSQPSPQAQQVFKAVGIDHLPSRIDGYRHLEPQ